MRVFANTFGVGCAGVYVDPGLEQPWAEISQRLRRIQTETLLSRLLKHYSPLLLVDLQEVVSLPAAVGDVFEEIELLLLAVRPDYQTVE